MLLFLSFALFLLLNAEQFNWKLECLCSMYVAFRFGICCLEKGISIEKHLRRFECMIHISLDDFIGATCVPTPSVGIIFKLNNDKKTTTKKLRIFNSFKCCYFFSLFFKIDVPVCIGQKSKSNRKNTSSGLHGIAGKTLISTTVMMKNCYFFFLLLRSFYSSIAHRIKFETYREWKQNRLKSPFHNDDELE